MRSALYSGTFFLLLMCSARVTVAQEDPSGSEIESRLSYLENALKTRNIEAIGAVCAEDALLKMPGVPDGTAMDSWTCSTVWKKPDNTWFIVRDVISSNGQETK